MSVQHSPETIKTMGKNELIRLIIDSSEEHGIDWSTYGSLNRKKQAELAEIAQEVLHATGELTAEESNGDVLGKSEDWEYAEPNKPNWMKANEEEAETGLEDVETNGIADIEEFEDVAEVVAEVRPSAKKTGKVAKEPKIKKEKAPKAPKEPKAPRTRTYTAEQIQEMIRLVEEAGWKKSKVAEQFECSGTFIHNVLVGNVYRDITGRGAAKTKPEAAAE